MNQPPAIPEGSVCSMDAAVKPPGMGLRRLPEGIAGDWLIGYEFLRRYSAERARAVSPSPRARVEAV